MHALNNLLILYNLILYFLQKWLIGIDIQLFRRHPTKNY